MDDLTNVQIDSYLIEGEIGRGGMARVYRASHVRLGRVCAVKVLRPEYSSDERFIYRFLQEARSAAQLDHPNIVPIYDTGRSDDGQLFIAMKYLEGVSLLDIMAESKLSRRDALLYLGQMATALDYAHSRNIVHRDVKPGNIIIDEDGWLTLTDFGIAKQIDDPTTQSTHIGSLIGTPAYMAPEQIQGETTSPRTDVYQLGALAYEMLSGSQPFPDRVPTALLVAHLQEIPEPIHVRDGELDPAVSLVVQRALEKKPEDRYESTTAFVEDLERVVDPESEIDTRPVHNQRGPEASTDYIAPVISRPLTGSTTGTDGQHTSTAQTDQHRTTEPAPTTSPTTDQGSLPTVHHIPTASAVDTAASNSDTNHGPTIRATDGDASQNIATGNLAGTAAVGALMSTVQTESGSLPGSPATDQLDSQTRERALPLSGAGLWFAGGAAIVLVLIAGAAAMFSGGMFGGGDDDPTATPTAVISTPGTTQVPVVTTLTSGPDSNATKSSTATSTSTPTTSPTATPTPTPTRTRTPTPTATSTPTPVPPTATPVPPTATPVPPTSTPVPPTPIPPTNTPVPVPPTNTPVPLPPTPTPTPPFITGP